MDSRIVASRAWLAAILGLLSACSSVGRLPARPTSPSLTAADLDPILRDLGTNPPPLGDTFDDSAQPLFGDTVRYELLCRRHYRNGSLTPED